VTTHYQPAQAADAADQLDGVLGYTIEELARVVGMSPRNIRSHQARRLLAPPVRRGRLAFYDDAHVRRLESIKALQRQGFNLVSIEAILGVRSSGPDSRALVVLLERLAEDYPSLVYVLSRHGVVGRTEDGTMAPARPRALLAALELQRVGLRPAPALQVLGEILDAVWTITADLVHATSSRVLALSGETAGPRLTSWQDIDRYTNALTQGMVSLLTEALRVAVENHVESSIVDLVAQRGDGDDLQLECVDAVDSG